MNSPHLLKIERDINSLSLVELEWLLEYITKQVQEKKQGANKFTDVNYINQQLAAMANDSDIQAEIAAINHE
ncbi:MAG: hypothetical protein V7K32_11665 [Nostoc sp.]|uniref:hypothetical protein n=1 Tax=Nostoc sp. TaxID=1180 RepID=UPI002FF64E37